MRRPIVPIACILALITGAWFGQAYALFAPLDPVMPDDTAARRTEETAWIFYDAIDLLLRTGDDAALHAVIASDFVDHSGEPDTSHDRASLLGYLASLRETHPDLRVVPGDVIAQADRVVVRLTVTGASDAAVLGVPLVGAEPWPQTDILRVHDGKVVERWGHGVGYPSSDALVSATLPFPYHGAVVPNLFRVTLAEGDSERTFTLRGPAMILAESGQLNVTLPVDESGATLPAGHSRTLVAGGSTIIPHGTVLVTLTGSTASAIALTLTPVESVPAAAGYSGGGSDAPPPSGGWIASLAGYTASLTHTGDIALDVSRVTLSPGSSLGLHRAAGVEMVTVESGTLTALIDGGLNSAWRMDDRGRSTIPGGLVEVQDGHSVTVSGDASTVYRNETSDPVTLLLLSLTAA